MKIYRLEMTTSNPSADRYGFFETKKDINEIEKKWKEIIKNDEDDYYGPTYFEREEITLGDFD